VDDVCMEGDERVCFMIAIVAFDYEGVNGQGI
jgi:hypothetical protein